MIFIAAEYCKDADEIRDDLYDCQKIACVLCLNVLVCMLAYAIKIGVYQ